MAISLTKTDPATVTVAARSGHGNRSSDEVARDTLVTVYRMLRAYLDVDPARQPLQYSVNVYEDLVADGWPATRARRYAHAARLACVAGINPATGQPLTGIAAIHPVLAQAAADAIEPALVEYVLPEVANSLTLEEAAWRVVETLAGLGWRPT
jgi:hypothetical protein